MTNNTDNNENNEKNKEETVIEKMESVIDMLKELTENLSKELDKSFNIDICNVYDLLGSIVYAEVDNNSKYIVLALIYDTINTVFELDKRLYEAEEFLKKAGIK